MNGAAGRALKLLVEKIKHVVLELVHRPSLLPLPEVELHAVLRIALEYLLQLLRELRVPESERNLVVDLERAIVEIRRAERAPHAVDRHHFLMQQRLRIFEYAHAA